MTFYQYIDASDFQPVAVMIGCNLAAVVSQCHEKAWP
jgi:hypothetical protein